MKKLEKLTPKQEAKLSFYKEKWFNKIFNYELYNSNTFENVRDKMKELYKFCNLEEPIVLFFDSPLACQIAVNLFKNLNQVENQVENQVRNQVRNQVENQIWNQVRNQVWNQVENQVRNQVENQIWNQVENQIENQVENQLKFEPFSSYINYSDFGWLSFYEFFDKETSVLKEFTQQLKIINSFVDCSFMQIQLEKLCIVSKYPCFISRNPNNEMHNINEYAIRFDDGYGQHYFNGIFITSELFEQLISKSYTFEQWAKETNEEIKSLVLAFYEEKFGGEFVFRFLSKYLKEIDTYIDKKAPEYLEKTTGGINIGVYTLFKGKVNNIDISYVRTYDYSSERMFFLGVHPDFTTAKQALASLCQLPKQLKPHLKEIRRQGEVYSYTFDEKGTNLLKNKKVNIQEVESLTGEEYFSHLTWEY